MAYVYTYNYDNVVRYVGKGNNDRDSVHLTKCKNKRFKRWLESLAANGSVPTIVRIADDITEEDAFQLEERLIASYGRVGYDAGGTLWNHSVGGRGGTKGARFSVETCARMSLGQKNRLRTVHDGERIRVEWQDPIIRKNRIAGLRRAAANPAVQAKKSASMRAAGMSREKHPNSKMYLALSPEGKEYKFMSVARFEDMFPHLPASALRSSMYSGKPVSRGVAKGWQLQVIK